MVRPREPIKLIQAKGKKHLTKDEIEKREHLCRICQQQQGNPPTHRFSPIAE